MKRTKLLLFSFMLLSIAFSSCKLFDPSIMLRSNKSYPYTNQTDTHASDYIIQSGDLMNFRLYSNQGFKIIDLTSLDDGNRGGASQGIQRSFEYLVEADSSINLPIIGRVEIGGMNLKEAEFFLEDKYSNYYNDPFIMLQVVNRRIIVFPGEGGAAKVINIQNEYTTIIEALALAGGITERGKAHRVKVVRGPLNDPEIFNLDLSTAEGVQNASLHYVRANDIIYVEPSYFAGKRIIQTTSQVLGIVSSVILTYFLILQFQNRTA